jgi:predicted nuclease of predicted toxin-antitoxin system
LKLLLDEMFSPLVAAELRARGHDAVAIKEREEWQSLSDPEVIALARTEQRAVVTANVRDFRPLHAELVAPGGKGHVGMVFLPTSFRPTRAATGQIVEALVARLAEYPGGADLANGETWISAELTG